MDKKKNYMILAVAGAMVLIFAVVLIAGFLGKKPPVQEEAEETTAVPEVTAPVDDDSLVLSFIGDCIIGSESGKVNEGNFAWMAENKTHDYFFSKVYGVLSEDDLTIANVECVLTDRDLEKTGKDYSPAFWFKAPASDADILTKGSVEFASVVNNHTYDYGEEGYTDTVDALKAQGMYVGESLSPVYIEKKGIKLGILCCNLWGSYQTSYIEDALKEMQDECDYKIVFFHGGTEAVHEPDNYKINACRQLAMSGLCDLIVGSHPHVLQPMEEVNGVPIMYSLGNFCYSANTYPENKTVIFQVKVEKTDTDLLTFTRFVPCYVYTGAENNYQPAVMTDGADVSEVMEMVKKPVEYQTETEPETEETTAVSQEPVVNEESIEQTDSRETDEDVYSDTQVYEY